MKPCASAVVTFAIDGGGGTVSGIGWTGIGLAEPSSLSVVAGPSINVLTDTQGRAEVTWTLGSAPGPNTAEAFFPTIDSSTPFVVFHATGT